MTRSRTVSPCGSCLTAAATFGHLGGHRPKNKVWSQSQLRKLIMSVRLGSNKRNPATKQMMYELVNDPLDHVISPKNSPDVYWDRVGFHEWNEPSYYPPRWYEMLRASYPEQYGDTYVPSGGRIRYDPNVTVPLPGAGYAPHPEAEPGAYSDISMPPIVVLAHELGHAYGYRDPKRTQENVERRAAGKNVERVENPLRKALGLPQRMSYFVYGP